MTSAMDEVFGPNANRPNHPDFWRLADVLLSMDGATEAAGQLEGPDEREKVFTDIIESVANKDVVVYVAAQRAGRIAVEVQKVAQGNLLMGASAAWIDGFLAGCKFTQGNNEPGESREEGS